MGDPRITASSDSLETRTGIPNSSDHGSVYTAKVQEPEILVTYLNDTYHLQLPLIASGDKGLLSFSRNETSGRISVRFYVSNNSRLNTATYFTSFSQETDIRKIGGNKKPVMVKEMRTYGVATQTTFDPKHTQHIELSVDPQNVVTALGDMQAVICSSQDLKNLDPYSALCEGINVAFDSRAAALEGVLKRSLAIPQTPSVASSN